MGTFAASTLFSNDTGPAAGAGLDSLALNQKAILELEGAQGPISCTIADGSISPTAAYVIVDTEGGAAADDLDVISPVLSASENLHVGMIVNLKAADSGRVITVKNSGSVNGINTYDGNDYVLSPTHWLKLQLRSGKWYEVEGRAMVVALAAATAAEKASTPATTTSRGIGRVATSADMVDGTTITNGPAFIAAGVHTSVAAAAGKVPVAGAEGNLNSWVNGFAKSDLSNVDTSKANVVLQHQATVVGASATGSTLIPADDTIPQNTEGDQFMSITFTPKSSTSKIRVDVMVNVSSSAAVGVWGALFLDSNASAFAASVVHMGSTGAINPLVMGTVIDSPGIASHTIKLRLGSGNSGSGLTFNGSGAARNMGGVFASYIMITEYAV